MTDRRRRSTLLHRSLLPSPQLHNGGLSTHCRPTGAVRTPVSCLSVENLEARDLSSDQEPKKYIVMRPGRMAALAYPTHPYRFGYKPAAHLEETKQIEGVERRNEDSRGVERRSRVLSCRIFVIIIGKLFTRLTSNDAQ